MNHVLRLWVRPEKRGEMVERDALTLRAGEGVEGDHQLGGRRHVTLVFEDEWAAALRDLGREVGPEARRANVFLSGAGGETLLGRRVRLGGAEIEIRGVVAPCHRMDEAAAGLKDALAPDARGGLWGVVLAGGPVNLGDPLTPLPPA